MDLIAPVQKRFTTHRAVIPHAAWLDQPSGHCPIFLTAASRRSLDRVSVPVWGTSLSGPLNIVALVGRYPTNWLMLREPIRHLLANFLQSGCPLCNLCGFRPRFHGLSPCDGHVAHALRTLAPVAGGVLLLPAAPRLACVKPAASVHPEPGSNSSLYNVFIFPSLDLALILQRNLTLSLSKPCRFAACLHHVNERLRFRSGLQR